MSKKFSTKAETPIESLSGDLPFIFHDEFDISKQLSPFTSNENEPTLTMVEQSVSQLDEISNEELVETSQTNNLTPIEPEIIDYSNIDPKDLTVDQLLQLKLNQHGIHDVTINHLGYNTLDDYIITEYDVIDNQTKNVLLIINVHLKQVRFQIPKHTTQLEKPKKRGPKSKKKTDMTPMELVAREMQKELKYSWSDWF